MLAEPDSQLTDRTWATLADGTPLVTAQRRGKGLLVLFHVTADTRWSDLPLAGTFVDMLRRIVSLAGSTATADNDTRPDAAAPRATQVVPPTRVLDGFGAFYAAAADRAADPGRISPAAPAPIIRPASTGRRKAWSRSIRWRPPTGRCRSMSRALNARIDVYRHGEPLDLRGPIFLAALALLMLDALVVFWLSGGFGSLLHAPARGGDARCACGAVAAWPCARRRPRPRSAPAQASSRRSSRSAGRLRHEGDAADPPRLHRHRRRRRR